MCSAAGPNPGGGPRSRQRAGGATLPVPPAAARLARVAKAATCAAGRDPDHRMQPHDAARGADALRRQARYVHRCRARFENRIRRRFDGKLVQPYRFTGLRHRARKEPWSQTRRPAARKQRGSGADAGSRGTIARADRVVAGVAGSVGAGDDAA